MPDDDILVRMHNIIREHLPCEVWILNFCHQALCTRGVLGQLPVNVLIASFSIYARNLIDLFYDDDTYVFARRDQTEECDREWAHASCPVSRAL